MTIELYTTPILNEIRQKSHLEVQDIQDPAQRYNARAGLDKEEEIYRCFLEGMAQARHKCLRFLREQYVESTDDAPVYSDSSVFEFAFSERRALNKAEPLTAALHALVVQYALAKFYSTVNQVELSNKHSLLAVEAGNKIDELLYTKQPPRV